jgi:expansin (peptidoglycan-binding protein)
MMFSMQVLNTNSRVQTLEVSTNGGQSWIPANRQTYNYFQIDSDTGTDSVSVKLRCVNQVYIQVDNVNVNVNGGAETTANANC